jgi:hypothetical protein
VVWLEILGSRQQNSINQDRPGVINISLGCD